MHFRAPASALPYSSPSACGECYVSLAYNEAPLVPWPRVSGSLGPLATRLQSLLFLKKGKCYATGTQRRTVSVLYFMYGPCFPRPGPLYKPLHTWPLLDLNFIWIIFFVLLFACFLLFNYPVALLNSIVQATNLGYLRMSFPLYLWSRYLVP